MYTKQLKGSISVPGDKSISHRAVLFGAIAQGKTNITGFLMGEDCLSTISCFRKMGIEIEINETNVIVHGKGLQGLSDPGDVLYTGNSGTTTRLLCGLLAGQKFSSILDGDETIRKRPMNRVASPLIQMGAKILCTNGTFCPLEITGSPLHGISYQTPVASAQLKSALILAGLYAQGETVITEPALSRNHTELMLPVFGGKISTCGNTVRVSTHESLTGAQIKVPGDISSAAYFIVAAVINPGSEILIQNVGINKTRIGILDVLTKMGAYISFENRRTWGQEPVADLLVRSSDLTGTVIEGNIIPTLIDEIPILAVAAAFAHGETVIRNAAELKVKESNRIDTVCQMLQSAGISATPTEDGMVIRGGDHGTGAVFETHNDHRIAMSAAVLATRCTGESSIANSQCASISYPDFYSALEGLRKS